MNLFGLSIYHLKQAEPLLMYKSVECAPEEADLTVYTDAPGLGM